MERKINLRRGFLIPIVAVLSLLTSVINPTNSYAANKTITYNSNGATSGVVPTGGTYAVGFNYTVLGNIGSPPLAKTNYSFAGWNTLANGTGATYQPGSNYIVPNANTTFYAIWGASVTYDGNSASGGTAPVDASSPYKGGTTVTVLGNTGGLYKNSYAFVNWNTVANGTGTSYSAGNTFSASTNVILYAQWTPTYTVIYNGNTNTGGTVPNDTSSPYVGSATVTVLGNSGALTKTGSTFSNWNTAANGSGTSYAPTNTFIISSNTVLYAQWRASITYNANGATGGTVPVDASSPYLTGTTITVIGNTGSLVKTGSNFASWNTAANGSGTTYTAGNTFALNADTVLYAQWSVITYTVTYDGNGNTGGSPPTDGSSPYASGSLVTVLGNTGSLVKTGYSFSNWNTVANGSGTSYAPSATFNIGTNTTLYAQWTSTFTLIYNGNSNTGGTVPVDGSSPYLSGALVTVLGNTGSLVKTGNTFAGWNTSANGSGTSYAPSATFNIAANTVLYAQWTASITYNANGATGGAVPTDASSPYRSGTTITVLGNTGSLVKTDYNFTGWNTAANGSGTSYAPGNTFALNVDTVLYAQWSVITRTLTYSGNGNTGGTAPVDGSSPYATGSLVTVLGNTGSLVKTGYLFSNWNTAANGSGTAYAPSATFNITSDTILYAQWAITYTVIYDEDGASGGTVPVDGSSPYLSGTTVTVLGNTGSLIKPGSTFVKWNTQLNGSGTDYLPGATFTVTSNVVLYPQWSHTLTYSENGATGGTVPVDANSPYMNGLTVTVLGNTGSLVKTGNTFSNWNTAANGSGTSYSAGNTFAIGTDTVLYAQWRATVTYDGNGNTGGTAPVDGASPYLDGSTVTVLGNSGSLARSGYVFAHWNTAANGSGINYSPADTFAIAADTNLYAQWTITYTVTYYPNGATSGSVPIDGSSPYVTGATVTVLGNTGPLVRTGNTFSNWNTAADGSGSSYSSGGTFTISSNTILYAQWRASITYNGNGATGGTVPVDGSSPYLNGATVTVLGNIGSLVKTGDTFVNWNTAANGSGTPYSAGNTISISANTILYAQWTPTTYTVTYNGNGNTGGAVPVDSSSPYLENATVTVLGNTGSLVKTGYIFDHWNTAANGSGTSYTPTSTFSIGANTILYAQWTITYTVTYHPNGATGGSVPIDGASPYATGASVTVLANTGSLVRTGNTFANWNTAADGTGTQYAPAAVFSIGANTILYAQWRATVTYAGNGNTGGSVPVDGLSPYLNGVTVTVLGNSGALVKTGNTFSNWNTAANGSGTSYAAGGTFAIAADTVLYAQWRASVTYNGNGNTGGLVPVDASSPYLNGTTVTVLGNTGSLVRTGFVFDHWNTAANGSGTSYSPTNTFTISADTILYAQWTVTYTLTYFTNGATGGSVPVDGASPYATGSTVTVLGNTGSLVKTGNTFANWNTAANGSGSSYASGATFTINADTILYAQWRASVTYNANGATGGTVPVDGSSPYLNGSTVTVLGNSSALVKTGYAFARWNTAANGSGTYYSPADTFAIAADTILYAQWTLTYTVAYDGNGSTGGTVPTDSSSPYINGSTVTVLGNSGTLVKTGYSFSDWNTAANGSGFAYDASDTFAIGANTTMYAQWTPLGSYSVTYNGNGSTGGTVPVDGLSPYFDGSTVTVLGNTGSMVKFGYTFANWNTAANGSGTAYSSGNTFVISGNTVLHAQWTPLPTWTLTYNGNGNTGGSIPIDAASPYLDGATATVLGNTGSLVKTGCAFLRWNTAANGSGTNYSATNSFTITANTVLYAQWTPTYTVTYDEDGATGGTVPIDPSSPYVSGATVTVLGNTGGLTRTGNTFSGWDTTYNGTGSAYSPGSTFTIGANIILYAQWHSTLTYNSNGATGGSVPVDTNSPYEYGVTVTVLGNTGSLVNTGHTFSNWNTAANGSGTAYASGNTFSASADVILYAQWRVTLTYTGNGNTGGSAPNDALSPYLDNATVTVLGNTGSLVKTGYVFARWNTAANGTGANYSAGNTFAIAADTVLYAQWTPTYTVTYDEDGATGGVPPIDGSSPYASGSTVTVLGNTGSLTRTGNTFSGWDTTYNGTGTAYSPGSTFTISSNIILYAQWHATVTYNANGATSGNVPVDGLSPYENGTSVTVLANTGSLVRTGYVFVNWNTAANGSGTSYAAGNSFVIAADSILYAQWATVTYSVTYNGNTNTGGSVPVDASSPYGNGATVTVLGNSGSLVKTGYIFDHWNTAVDNSGTSYAPSATFSIGANTTLYAQWVATYIVTYDADGATGGSVPVDSSNPYVTGSTVTVLGNTGSLTRAGNTFSGWDMTYNGTGTAYAPGSTFTITSNVTLYAQWHASITYNANGATGGTVPVDGSSPYENGSTVTVLGNTGSLVKAGYTFANWNTAANGSGTFYAPTDTFEIAADIILYAQWTLVGTHTVTYNANGATSGNVPIDSSSPYVIGATVTVRGNTGTLARIGHLFINWNTAANGSGTSYSPSATFTINANTILYAQWSTTYVVIYDEDGATGGTVPVDPSSPYLTGSSVTILGNTGSLVKTGSIFLRWNTVEDGSGTAYTQGTVITIGDDLVLYAQWSSTITYGANGATGGTVPVDGSSPYVVGTTVVVLGNIGTLTKTGNIFSHWNTAANGSGISYYPSDSFTVATNTVLYAQWVATVTYNGNGATSGSVPVDSSSPYAVGSTVTVKSNSGSLMKVGTTFSKWNTAADGSGTSYAPSATFTLLVTTTLYAQWTGTHTLLYDNDGATGGTIPADLSSPYADGATVTVLGNTGSLVKTGNSFAGWNTVEDGTGTHYSPGDSFTIRGDTTLFAQWTATVTYHANGATGGTAPTDASSPYPTPYGATAIVTVLGNTGSLVKRDGGHYDPFSGWNTAANGSGTIYRAGDTFTLSGNVDLYAQWGALSFNVTYSGNGSTSGAVPVDASSPYADAATVTVKTNSGVLAKVGFRFANWNTAANGSGTSYSPGATFVADRDVILYAQWISVYTLLYDEDDATGGVAPIDTSSPYTTGSTVTVLGNTGSLVRTGNTFAGWNTVEDGSGTHYLPGATFTINATTTLYAQWTVTVTYDGDGATGGTVPVDASSPYSNAFGGQTLVTVLPNSGSLVRAGYTFVHWGTGPNNTGEHFRPGDQFIIQQNTVLYAHWELIGTHNVVYNDNGATSGTVPTDSNNPYVAGSTITVLGNTGSLAKSGSIFDGWNTSADGTGLNYEPSDQFVINAATILYALWTTDFYVVTYDANGATSGVAPTDSANPYEGGDVVTILANSGSLARSGYAFAGWNTSADGSGTTYSASGTSTFTIVSDTTLYAVWTLSHTVTFVANTGTGTMSAQTSNVAIALKLNSFVKADASFNGWNTKADGSGVKYADGAMYFFVTDATLYAQWFSTVPVTTTEVITAPIATVEVPVSALIDVDGDIDSVVAAALEIAGGGKVEIEIIVPAGAIASPITLTIAPATTTAAVSNGLLSVKVTALDSGGTPVTHFDRPISVNLGHISPTAVPMFSEDGVTWIRIPLISGTTLPDGMPEGYYVNSFGHVVVLTRHLTYFGFRKAQRNLIATSRAPAIEAGKHTRIIATGGSGRGIRSFLTSTPNVCTVSTGGLLTGLSAGICTFVAIRNGDGIYASAMSSPNNVTITKTAQRRLWLTSTVNSFAIGKVATLKVYGGSGSGVLTFESNSPSICSVSAQGEVVALKAGRCGLSVTKASDETYHPYSSEIFYLEIMKSTAVRK